jgi:hypothetical protein
MAGVRIHLMAGQQRGLAGVVFDTKIPYGRALFCKACDRWHKTKVYHVNLDDNDTVIVSTGVLAQLKKVGAIGTVFEVWNEVENPPRQIIKIGEVKQDHNYTDLEVR